MTFAGAYISAAKLEVVGNRAPEPGTHALMALDLVAVGAVARRKA